MRLSILSNVNLDMLSGLLKKENEVFQTDGYGEWITYALKKDERLAAFAPECLFLLLDGNALLEGCQDMGTPFYIIYDESGQIRGSVFNETHPAV